MSTTDKLNYNEQIIQQLEEGIKNILESDNFKNWCKTTGKYYVNNYSFNNSMLIYLQKKESTYVMGYEAWKSFGRQVKSGAKGIKILMPIFAYEKSKDELYKSIKKSLENNLKNVNKDASAQYRLGQSKFVFTMQHNGILGLKVNEKEVLRFSDDAELKKFINNNILGKIPFYYSVGNVFDYSDTFEPEFLWLKTGNFEQKDLAIDNDGNSIKNKKGEYKVYNTIERKSKFNPNLDFSIKEYDEEKMDLLFDVLKKVSLKKGVPVILENIQKEGLYGYYQRGNNNLEEKIVINTNITATEKVATTFHELAHSILHKDVNDLSEKMGGEKITHHLKEIQAEAVAYMTANNFGIETNTQSFNYLAMHSLGKELSDLKKSLIYIHKTSMELMKDIEQELKSRNLNLNLEEINKVSENSEKENNDFADAEFQYTNENIISDAKFKILKDEFIKYFGSENRTEEYLSKKIESIIKNNYKSFQAINATNDLELKGCVFEYIRYKLGLISDKNKINKVENFIKINNPTNEIAEYFLEKNSENDELISEIQNELKSFEKNQTGNYSDEIEIVNQQLLYARKIFIELKNLAIIIEDDKMNDLEKKSLYDSTKKRVALIEEQIKKLNEDRINKKIEYNKSLSMDFLNKPIEVIQVLKKDYNGFEKITDKDISYLSTSEYIKNNRHLLKEPEKFIKMANDRLNDIKKVADKDGNFVEIDLCERWTEIAIFNDGDLMHPKLMNKILAKAEKEIRKLKIEAEKNNEYFPYNKCKSTFYVNSNDHYNFANVRIDIGDGFQNDYIDYFRDLSKNENNQKLINLYINKLEKSFKERPKISDKYISSVDIKEDQIEKNIFKDEIKNNSLSISQWKQKIDDKRDFIQKDKLQDDKNNEYSR